MKAIGYLDELERISGKFHSLMRCKYKFVRSFIIAIITFSIFVISCGTIIRGDYISDVYVVQDKLCFFDHHQEFARKPLVVKPFHLYNLYIADAGDGTLLHDEIVGYDIVWISSRENLVLMKDFDVYFVYDTDKFEKRSIYTHDYLQKKEPAFSSGIARVENRKDLLLISTKNGESFFYDPFADAMTEKPADDYFLYKDYSFNDKAITYIENGRSQEIYFFRPQKQEDELMYLIQAHKPGDSAKTSINGFIGGCCIGLFPEANIMFIKSYTTTDRTDFLITALDMDLQTYWRKYYGQLIPQRESSIPVMTSDIIPYNDAFLMAIGRHIISFDKNGETNWVKDY